jgi:chromate reductase
MVARVQLLGVCGSLRRGSFNRLLLEAARELVPKDATLEITGIEGIPVYDQDREGEPTPELVAFKRRIREADAVVFATPEYNYGVPGPLKNAIDAASRPYGDNAWKGKPVGIMSASVGMLGGARAAYHLRQSFIFLEMHPMNLPEVFVAFAPKKFDAQGRLTDAETRKVVERFLAALVEWTRTIGRVLPPPMAA